MKISYNWLKKYVDLDLSPEELEDKMTFGGIEVEAIEKSGENLDQIIIGEIKEKYDHPNADKLAVCKVNDGKNDLQIVCGAPNCKSGQKIALAPIGTMLGDFKIKKVNLRGEDSFGMICSEKELGISENHDGIMELPEDAPIGKKLSNYLEVKDTCYDVEITPNRPDLLGMIGVARDVAALLQKPLRLPKVTIKDGKESIRTYLSLQNDAPDLCTRYTARMIKDVTIKESPEWMKKHLRSIGLRPINNIVDITNFVMMEYGHPLHAFDYNDIAGKKIIMRKAQKNEKFSALNEKKYTLEESDLVIADEDKPIAIAGVIGGVNSHITPKTNVIVLEAANFLYSSIRNTSKRLNISTDSSYRFERDIADETVEKVSERATQLILQLAGGTLINGFLDSYPDPKDPIEIGLRRSRVKKILTIDISSDKIKQYLETLGLELLREEEDIQTYRIPPYRKDLTREIDLIEEIMRLHGYNNVETHIKPQNIMNNKEFYLRRKAKDMLVNYGFSEVRNWNFADPENLDKLTISEEDERRQNAKLKNPLGDRFAIMRSILLPDILKNVIFNINHGQKDLKLFEMAKTFTRNGKKLAKEIYHVSGIMTGILNPIYWKEKQNKIDFFDLKGIVEELLSIIGVNNADFNNSKENYYQPGMGADILFDDLKIGSLGKLDPKIAQKFDIEQEIFAFDINLDKIFTLDLKLKPTYSEIPKFPPVLRDLSFLVEKKFNYADIINTMIEVDPALTQIDLFDEFTGKNIREDKRSLTFSLVFSSKTKTLTDEYIHNIINKVKNKLKEKYQIEMR